MTSIKRTLSAFHDNFKVLSLSVFATIFTWAFINGIRTSILTPAILSLIDGEFDDSNTSKLTVNLRKGKYKLKFGLFLTELIQWLIFMGIIFLIWIMTRKTENK